mmetsp:Transcript_95113/g.212997  ORF Transcript_95113/g.212997 Transcript_95113/m.212997 type:complete len:203 (-) Transcript_95113:14-622(-)
MTPQSIRREDEDVVGWWKHGSLLYLVPSRHEVEVRPNVDASGPVVENGAEVGVVPPNVLARKLAVGGIERIPSIGIRVDVHRPVRSDDGAVAKRQDRARAEEAAGDVRDRVVVIRQTNEPPKHAQPVGDAGLVEMPELDVPSGRAGRGKPDGADSRCRAEERNRAHKLKGEGLHQWLRIYGIGKQSKERALCRKRASPAPCT